MRVLVRTAADPAPMGKAIRDAERSSVVWLVMRQGLTLVALGLVAGVGVALATTRLMSKLLFNTPPLDTPTFGVVAALRAR
jgi:hypothetical protein